jgi:hypothetical protein
MGYEIRRQNSRRYFSKTLQYGQQTIAKAAHKNQNRGHVFLPANVDTHRDDGIV